MVDQHADKIKGVSILGSTGTIGMNTLDVLARHPDRYKIIALTANVGVDRLFEQCMTHRPLFAVMMDDTAAEQLDIKLRNSGSATQVLSGIAGLETVAAMPQTDYVMAAIVGAAGLLPTLAAARAGKRILLANKEALVMSGALFMEEVRQHHATLLPIDSEHNAIFQCMPNNFSAGLERSGVNRILLTASGGPFRRMPIQQLASVTPEQAVAHPNWVMGKKISVDSASMMNKGLEVIEACYLFATTPDKIQVVIHPQSVIHSMVSYNDGSVLAQLGNPDMRTPIAHALAWPDRIESGVEPLDLFAVARLDFEQPDLDRFPCLAMAYQSLQTGGTATTVLNAANEIAVEAFLGHKLKFTDIATVIEKTLEQVKAKPMDSIDVVMSVDTEARMAASEWVNRKGAAA